MKCSPSEAVRMAAIAMTPVPMLIGLGQQPWSQQEVRLSAVQAARRVAPEVVDAAAKAMPQ
jgi:hypothetical protein